MLYSFILNFVDTFSFLNVFKYLIQMRKGEQGPDDIDHLGNRRVRSAGELVENQARIPTKSPVRVTVTKLVSNEIDQTR